MNKIIDIIENVETGVIYIKTIDNKRKRSLYKDIHGYYVKSKGNMVDRFMHSEDINKIEKILK